MAKQDPLVVKVFARHAKSVNNELAESSDRSKNLVGGYQPNIPLAEVGKGQGRRLGGVVLGNLAEMFDRPTRVVRFGAAPSVRTRETARYIREGMEDYTGPITILPHLHELRKGNKWLGGDEKRLRSTVENEAYWDRRASQDWDFRSGRVWANRLGLYVLHGAETPREVGARVLQWFNEVPPITEEDRQSGDLLVDMVVSHGLAGRYGVGQLLHTNPDDPSHIGISVKEADAHYHLANATAFVLTQGADGVWTNHDRIIP